MTEQNDMRARLLFILFLFFGLNTFAQKMTGYGGELSALGFKPNVRMWLNKTNGFEIFGGIGSEMTEFKLNDFEAGFKLLNAFLYDRKNRTYFGLVGKWKWVTIDGDPTTTSNLPVVGLLIGKEWSEKQIHRKGFAMEFGYQYGVKQYYIPGVRYHRTFTEFPLIINLRYSFYKE